MNGPLHIQSFLWVGWMKPIWLCLIDSAGWKSSADNELWIEGKLWANATGARAAGGGNDCINIYSRRKRLQGSNQYKLIWNEGLDWDFYSEAKGKQNWWYLGGGEEGQIESFCVLPAASSRLFEIFNFDCTYSASKIKVPCKFIPSMPCIGMESIALLCWLGIDCFLLETGQVRQTNRHL